MRHGTSARKWNASGPELRRSRDTVPSPRSTMRAAHVLLRALHEHGVRAAFGIPGGAAGPIFDALSDVPGISYVATRHEAIAAFAALGHARATGLPALVLTTAGPGVTNALTGVAAALLEEVPLIVLAGDVASTSAGRGAFQDGSPAGLDVAAILRPVTRWSTVVTSARAAAGAAARAFMTATSSRPGPVFLGVPFDVGMTDVEPAFVTVVPAPAVPPDVRACERAAHLLASARSPALVLGSGARGASSEARRVAERLRIPVAVTGHAKGAFPERHPLYVGLLGNAGHPSAQQLFAARPDVVCIVGSRVGDFATNGWRVPLAGTKATIQIDRDPSLVGRNVDVTLPIVGDAALALARINESLPLSAAPDPGAPRLRVHRDEARRSDAVPLKPQRVLAALSRAFPRAVWCSDIGEHMGMAQHYLSVESAADFHVMSGLGSMGSGIGAAIGIKQASPERTVVAIVGDGGFNMHAGEILTCVESGIDVVFAVFNDGRWNMVDHGFRAVFGRAPASMPRDVADLAGVARGYGALGVRIETPDDLAPAALRRLAGRGRPLVLDIRVDPEESLSVETRSAALVHAAEVRG